MYLNITLLALMQALLMTNSSMLIATTALIGEMLAPRPSLATLPMSMQYLATLLLIFPISVAMQKWGRKPILLLGTVSGVLGTAILAYAVISGSFWLFALGSLIIGLLVASGQFYRFAAADAATADKRSRAISLTLAGGIIAAFLGSNLARFTKDMMEPVYSAGFMILILVAILSVILAGFLKLPPMQPTAIGADHLPPRPINQLILQPKFIIAVLSGMIGGGSMILLMGASPLAIGHAHHEFSTVTSVIQWHIVAMFLPSFFTGDLIRRFGVTTIILLGGILGFAAISIGLSSQSAAAFHGAMIFIGLSWNFLYIGGSALLTETYHPSEKGRAQGINDSLIYGLIFIASLLTAKLEHGFGWYSVVYAAVPGMTIVTLAIIWLKWFSPAKNAALQQRAK
ncbi:MAG: MFS transporter [Candidatus Pacebacteria bacterium]|nr:MFS transporter [Candidatus Paceibacterota bacterium]